MTRWLASMLVAFAALCAAPSAEALCLNPVCTCTASTANVAFGTVNPVAPAATDSTGQVRVQCGGVAGLLINYRIDLAPGGSGNVAARRMASGALTLGYGLYSDASRLVVWGDASGGTPVLGSIGLDVLGLSSPNVHTVYGRIPGGQTTTAPGSYADSITVTVTYF